MVEIVGQDSALGVIDAALASGRLHHAWIFHGPPGVGKFTTATWMARTLLCPNAAADSAGRISACGECRSCQLIDEADAAHPDLHVVTKELALYSDDSKVRSRKLINIPRDVVDDHLIIPAFRSSQLRHGKVFIVDEAELLDEISQNLMLKTLEEPPASTFLILVTAFENRLLPTIRSRCQRVAFELIDDQLIRDRLPSQADQVRAMLERQREELETQKKSKARDKKIAPIDRRIGRLTISEEQMDKLIRLAGGSFGRARLALEYGLHQWADTLDPMLHRVTRGKPAAGAGDELAGVINDFAEEWVANHRNASKDAANKAGIRHLLQLIAQTARRHLAAIADNADPADPVTAERQLTPWLTGIDLLTEAQRDAASNVNMALLLENLMVQWAWRCRRTQRMLAGSHG